MNELRLIDRHPKYKTEMCKTFWDKGTCPYGKRCCFIHNEKDKLLEYQMAQKKLSEEAALNEGQQQETDLPSLAQNSVVNSPETSPALSIGSDVRPVRRKTTLDGSTFPFLLEAGSPLEHNSISGIDSPPVFSKRSAILPPGIPLDPIHDLSDILQETYLDATLQDDAIFRDIMTSQDRLASPSISIPKSSALANGGHAFLPQNFLSSPRQTGGLGFTNIISPNGSGFSNSELFEDNGSSSALGPFNEELFSKSWSSHLDSRREPRARTFTETQNLGLTNLVPLDESIGF
jgi:hypothetical protein